jgi:hypothetical protein
VQQARTSPRVYRLRMSRDWISRKGPKRKRHTTLVFVLRNPSVVEFVVVRVSPDCRRIGRFRVVGRRGVNRVRLGPRVGRHSLRPGTYRLVARAVPGGRTVVDTRLVVVRRPNRAEIAAARSADTCTSAEMSAQSGQDAAPGGGSGAGGPTGAKAAVPAKAKPARHQGVLGAKFARKAVEAVRHVPLWLYALLALAIVLLAAAALPLRAAPTRGAASTLARHRGVLALAGAVTLVAVMVTYVLL